MRRVLVGVLFLCLLPSLGIALDLRIGFGVSGAGAANTPNPTLAGQLLTSNATPAWALLAPGADGLCLTMVTGAPAWASCAAGSTGISAATANGAMYATSATTGTSTAALTNGQILVGRTGLTPVAASITATSPLTMTPGSGSITVACATCTTSAASLTNNQLVFGAGSQGVAIGDLTGDVTTAGGKATTIATAAVTLAKMANMATASFLGRNTAATGVPEVLSIATAKTMLGLTGTNSGDQTITLTGDVTGSGTGSFATTLATVNSNVGSFTAANITVDAKGRITAAASGAGGAGDVTAVGSCLTGDCFTSGTPAASLVFNNATSGTVTLQTVTGALGTKTVSLPAATGTLALAGSLDAPAYGVVCDGSTDTTTALQAAVTAAKSGTQGLGLQMPLGGTCKLSASIVVDSVIAFTLHGNGVKFTWAGNSTSPMFLCRDCRESRFHGFQVEASTTATLLAVFQFENGSGGTVTPTNNTVEDIFIEGTNGGITNAIRMASGAGGDNNNDFNIFKHVSVNNVANACAKIEHSQSKHNLFEDFACANNSIGVHVIETTAGSFHCIRCQGGYSTGADFYLANSTDGILISASNFEGSARLLETAGPSGAPFPVTIQSTRWVNNNLHADKKAVLFQFPGPLILLNNLFEAVAQNQPMEINFAPGGSIGGFVSLGNYFASTRANPYTGVQPKVSLGNVIDRNDTNNVVTLDTPLVVGQGGTGLTVGTSGGVPYFNATTTMASSAALTANLPVIGGGAGAAPTVGSRSGTTTSFATTTGTLTSGNCAQWDASGNLTATGSACGSATGLGDPGSNGVVVRTSSGTTTARTIAGTANQISVSNGDGVSGNPILSVPSSAQLSVAKLTNLTSNGFVKTSGGDGTLSIATPTYVTAFTAQTSITVTGATHGLGTADLTFTCWDGSTPRNWVSPNTVTVNSSSFDIVITFNVAQTGRCIFHS
jgi:hypothetical protein